MYHGPIMTTIGALCFIRDGDDAEEGVRSAYGRKFVITGPLTGPSGRTAILVSVWAIPTGEETPRFVTAYPGGN